jgi:UDP-N-acetylmuramate dehydrogenase
MSTPAASRADQPQPFSLPGSFSALANDLGPDRVRHGEVLAPYTTFKIGGPADLYYEARSPDELAAALLAARAREVPCFLLGMGANVLVGDRGFRGLVVRNVARGIRFLPAERRIVAESGAVVWPDLIERAIDHHLSGLEHYAGIPSTVGGALWQNPTSSRRRRRASGRCSSPR